MPSPPRPRGCVTAGRTGCEMDLQTGPPSAAPSPPRPQPRLRGGVSRAAASPPASAKAAAPCVTESPVGAAVGTAPSSHRRVVTLAGVRPASRLCVSRVRRARGEVGLRSGRSPGQGISVPGLAQCCVPDPTAQVSFRGLCGTPGGRTVPQRGRCVLGVGCPRRTPFRGLTLPRWPPASSLVVLAASAFTRSNSRMTALNSAPKSCALNSPHTQSD